MHRADDSDADRQADAPSSEQIRNELTTWAEFALGEDQSPAMHHRRLIAELTDLQAGRNDRLMVLMPPGSAKSTYASVLFPPWWLAQKPKSNIIACSHTVSLAGNFGQRVRSLISEHGGHLGYGLGERRARTDFHTTAGGSYFAVGVQGAVTGRRADLILIDDPVRSHLEAASAHAREQLWTWYRTDLLTRLKPGGRIVLIMTRWHEDDLGGRLLNMEPEWRCLRLPALAEEADPLGRPVGAALWPEWEDAIQLERKRTLVGERIWSAMYQQTPRISNDALFKLARLEVVDAAEPTHCVRGWDLAATTRRENAHADWTVGLKLGREASGRFVVLDVVRMQGSAHEVESAIVRMAARDGVNTLISLPQDPGQAGKHQVQYLVGALAGYRVKTSTESGSKHTRATPAASQIEAGNFCLLRGHWNQVFINELMDFPEGRNDDQVDALCRAFAEMCDLGRQARRINVGVMRR